MIKTFKGFKGHAAFGQIGDIDFAIIAETPRQLELLWAGIMEGVDLDPAGVKRAILIEAANLPEPRAKAPDQTAPTTQTTPPPTAIDV